MKQSELPSSRLHHIHPTNLSYSLTTYPRFPLALATDTRATNMADSMEGVVTEVEQPKAENVEQRAIAGM